MTASACMMVIPVLHVYSNKKSYETLSYHDQTATKLVLRPFDLTAYC